jgi:FtsZ-interacting cell division protein ZipA
MSDIVIVAIVNGAFAVIVLILGILLNRKVNKVKYQVVNGHSSNMREEGDERHAENSDKLDLIISTQKRHGGEITRTRNNVNKIFNKLDKHTDQIHDLEMTGPRPNLTGRKREGK